MRNCFLRSLFFVVLFSMNSIGVINKWSDFFRNAVYLIFVYQKSSLFYIQRNVTTDELLLIISTLFILSNIRIKQPFLFESCFRLFSQTSITKKGKLNLKTNKMRSDFKVSTISEILFSLIIIMILSNIDKLHESKQHNSVIEQITKGSQLFPTLFNDAIIWGASLGCVSESIDQGRSYLNDNINISHCFFSRSMVFTGYGGIIYVNGGTYSMNANYSMFYNCSCSNYGGAIYFSSTNSSLRMICANRCSANSGHFAYVGVSQTNYAEYLSVSNCSHTTSGDNSIRFGFGDQRFDNTNSSMNNAETCSGVLIYVPTSFSSSFCTFSNNKVSKYFCIQIYSTTSTTGTVSMSYANIVHNNSPLGYGVVYFVGDISRNMIFCIFKNNSNYLFCLRKGSLQVSHSFIYHSESSFSISVAVSTGTNNSFTNRMTYQIPFFNSHHCNADIHLSLRSLEKTISKTNQETLKKTYERTIDQTHFQFFPFLNPIIILAIS